MELENSDLKGEMEVSIFKKETERENISAWLERPSFKVAILSTFSALAVVFGYMLAFIPNIEIFTLTIFLSGFILGKKEGLIVGLLSSMIFTFFNPLGTSPLPLLLYQITHYSLTGFLGGFLRHYFNNRDYFKPKDDLYIFPILLILGLTGALITFFYDILSTFFGAMLFSQSFEYFLITYLLPINLIFTTTHLIGNVLGFVFILPGLIQLIIKLLD